MVRELPVQKVVEGKGHPEARAGLIFGSLAAAAPGAEPVLALGLGLELAMEGARDRVRAVVPDRGPAQVVVEPVRGLDRVVALAGLAEQHRVVEAVPAWDQGVVPVPGTKAREPSLYRVGGGPPRHC